MRPNATLPASGSQGCDLTSDFGTSAWPADRIERRSIVALIPYARNARTHSDEQIAQIAASIREWGWTMPVLVDEDDMLIAGHGRVLAAQQLGLSEAPAVVARGWSDAQKRAYRIADNKLALNAGWDDRMLGVELSELLAEGFDLGTTGFAQSEIDAILRGGGGAGGEHAAPTVSLADRFMLPPFSVLNAREGWWQARKAAWIALGLKSEIGRGDNLLAFSDQVNAVHAGNSPYREGRKANAIPDGGGGKGAWAAGEPDYRKAGTTIHAGLTFGEIDMDDGANRTISGTSIFDPVLCEIAYRWFCPPGGLVLDPFAGGSVRGIVAGRLGRRYRGVDLSAEQLAANEGQLGLLQADDPRPEWTVGDSVELAKLCKGTKADFVFSCPPYADLERYSDDPRDLSAMEYPDFLAALRAIISAACGLLRPNRFACFVVGEVRDDKGAYRGLVPDTVRAFTDAGLVLYNEAILVTAVGSLPVRVAKQFEGSRKLGKTHQNVLVFCKGDPRKATEAVGPVEFADVVTEQTQFGERMEQIGGEV